MWDALLVVDVRHLLQILNAFGVLLVSERHQCHVVEEVAIGNPHSLGLDASLKIADCKVVELCESENMARQFLICSFCVDVHHPSVQRLHYKETAVLAEKLQVHTLIVCVAQVLHQFHVRRFEDAAFSYAFLQYS